MNYTRLNLSLSGSLAQVTLTCPQQQNRIDYRLAGEIRLVCQELAEAPQIGAVIFTGSDGFFSCGRESLAGCPSGQREQEIAGLQVANAVAALKMPVLAAINGDALDHGLELALAADLRIADESAFLGLGDLPKGEFPWDGATQRLPRLVGPAWAQDMILTGRKVSATEALGLGLVNRVSTAGQTVTETRDLAEQILKGGPVAARYVKEAIYKGKEMSMAQGLALEADLNIILQSTQDRAEGIASFKEKRPPEFTGA